MTEPITAATEEARPVELRRLHPGVAFLGGVIGLGYLYVGRISYAIALLVAQYLFLFVAGWTRWPLTPFGLYTFFAAAVLLWLPQLAHPMALAWSRPLAPAKPYNRWWCYLAWLAGTTGLSFVFIPDRTTTSGYETYYVPALSMFPTVYEGDRVIADTWRYRDAAPAFGDIVVCDFGDGTLLIKRVVGVPGDTIELRGPLLVRNGSPVDEPYLNLERGSAPPDAAPLTLGAGEFFVLGDNRGNSNDSRFRGPVARDHIYGRVEFIYFSTAGGGVAWERFPVVLGGD